MRTSEIKLKLFRWIGSTLIVILLSSCSQKPQDAILAKWKEVGGTDTMEFFKDGSFNFVTKRGGTIGGNYKFVDEDRVKLEFGGFYAIAGPQIARVSFSGGGLSITLPDGKVSKLEKAN